MFGSYTAQEAVLAALVGLLAGNEIRGIIAARMAGRSRNLSRLISHGIMLALLGLWTSYTFYWVKVMDSPGVTIETFGSSALNLPYLLLGISLILIATFEILTLYRARRQGFTTNVSRLIVHGLMVLLVLTMVGLSLLKWSEYTPAAEHQGSILDPSVVSSETSWS